MARRRRSHTATFKAQVALAAIKRDRTLDELASRHGVHRTMIHAWKRRLLAGAEAVFASGANATRLETLLLENRDLRERERQCLLFMGRFVLGGVSGGQMKRMRA